MNKQNKKRIKLSENSDFFPKTCPIGYFIEVEIAKNQQSSQKFKKYILKPHYHKMFGKYLQTLRKLKKVNRKNQSADQFKAFHKFLNDLIYYIKVYVYNGFVPSEFDFEQAIIRYGKETNSVGYAIYQKKVYQKINQKHDDNEQKELCNFSRKSIEEKYEELPSQRNSIIPKENQVKIQITINNQKHLMSISNLIKWAETNEIPQMKQYQECEQQETEENSVYSNNSDIN